MISLLLCGYLLLYVPPPCAVDCGSGGGLFSVAAGGATSDVFASALLVSPGGGLGPPGG